MKRLVSLFLFAALVVSSFVVCNAQIVAFNGSIETDTGAINYCIELEKVKITEGSTGTVVDIPPR